MTYATGMSKEEEENMKSESSDINNIEKNYQVKTDKYYKKWFKCIRYTYTKKKYEIFVKAE